MTRMASKPGRYLQTATQGTPAQQRWLSEHKEAERAHVLSGMLAEAADALANPKCPERLRADLTSRVNRAWRAWSTGLDLESAKVRAVIDGLDFAHAIPDPGELPDEEAAQRSQREHEQIAAVVRCAAVRSVLSRVDPDMATRIEDTTILAALAVWRRGRGRPRKGSVGGSQWDSAAHLATAFGCTRRDGKVFRELVTSEGFYREKV